MDDDDNVNRKVLVSTPSCEHRDFTRSPESKMINTLKHIFVLGCYS